MHHLDCTLAISLVAVCCLTALPGCGLDLTDPKLGAGDDPPPDTGTSPNDAGGPTEGDTDDAPDTSSDVPPPDIDFQALRAGEWQPLDRQPHGRSFYSREHEWLGWIDGTGYFARSVRQSQPSWLITAVEPDGSWRHLPELSSELNAQISELSDPDVTHLAVHAIGGERYLTTDTRVTRHHPGGDEAEWQPADVSLKEATTVDGRMYATATEPADLRGVIYRTGDSDWQQIRAVEDYVYDFWVAGDAVHYRDEYTTDDGDSWQPHDTETEPVLGSGENQVERADGRYWYHSSEGLLSSTDGIDWEVHAEWPREEFDGFAAHDGELYCLASPDEETAPSLFRRVDETWKAIDVPDDITPGDLLADDRQLLVATSRHGLWRLDTSSDTLEPTDLPQGRSSLAAGDGALVAVSSLGSDWAVRSRGDASARWDLGHPAPDAARQLDLLEAGGDIFSEHRDEGDDGTTTLRLRRLARDNRLETWFESERLESISALVEGVDRLWLVSDRGVHPLAPDGQPAPEAESYEPDTWGNASRADLTVADGTVWTVFANDDNDYQVHRRTGVSRWQTVTDRLEDDVSCRIDSADLLTVDIQPVLAVACRGSDTNRRNLRLFGWNAVHSRWAPLGSRLEGARIHVEARFHATDDILLVAVQNGVFQFAPQNGGWSQLGGIEYLARPDTVTVHEGDVWLNRYHRGIRRFGR